MNAYQLWRYFPPFVDTEAQRDYGIHDTLKKAKKEAQKVWDDWKDQNHRPRERLKWDDEDPNQICGLAGSGNNEKPYMIVFLIHSTWKVTAPKLEYRFEDIVNEL